MNQYAALDAQCANSMCRCISVGFGAEITIRDVASFVAKVVGYKWRIEFDASKPDRTPRKLMDSARLNAARWAAAVVLEQGVGRLRRTKHERFSLPLQSSTLGEPYLRSSASGWANVCEGAIFDFGNSAIQDLNPCYVPHMN